MKHSITPPLNSTSIAKVTKLEKLGYTFHNTANPVEKVSDTAVCDLILEGYDPKGSHLIMGVTSNKFCQDRKSKQIKKSKSENWYDFCKVCRRYHKMGTKVYGKHKDNLAEGHGTSIHPIGRGKQITGR